jgi:capsular polysaccharide transport system permease protein
MMPTSTYSQAIAMQARVLWALCLREIHGKHGRTRLGYIWQFIKTGFGVGVFWWIRAMAGAATPHGIPLPLFLLMGFIPWYIFASGLRMTMEAVRTNLALLTFPQITPLDLCLSSWIVVAATEVIVLGLYMLGISMAGYHYQLQNPIALFCALAGCALMGFSLGLVLCAIALYLPATQRIVPMILRILFFISGIFFSPTQMGGHFGSFLYWNPLLNFIELARGSFVTWSVSESIKTTYIALFIFISLGVGLLLERFVRKRHGIQ